MNRKLEAIAVTASGDLRSLIEEGEKKILEAWSAAEQEGQDNETDPKFKLGLTITLDLNKDTMETALTFGIKHKLSTNREIPDPSQPSLPLAEGESSTEEHSGTVTMSVNGEKPIELSSAKFHRAMNKLSKKK